MTTNNDRDLSNDIVDLLRKCKFASSYDMADKLKVPRDSVVYYARRLRRTNPNISAISGRGYMWLEDPDVNDTGIKDETRVRIDAVRAAVIREKVTTVKDLCNMFELRDSTVHSYIKQLSHEGTGVELAHGRNPKVRYMESGCFSGYDSVSCLIINSIRSNPFIGYYNIVAGTGLSRSTVMRHVVSLQQDKEIFKTKSKTFVHKDYVKGLPDVSLMYDDTIRALKLLVGKRTATKKELISVMNTTQESTQSRVLNQLLTVCSNVTKIGKYGDQVFYYE